MNAEKGQRKILAATDSLFLLVFDLIKLTRLQAIVDKFEQNIQNYNMYRSFVTCDDPKGVVECGAIRRSKSASYKMEDNRRTQKKSNTSLAYKEKKEEMVPKEIIEAYHSPSSFQLREVSRGAQKLNQLIDSLSKGLSCDGQPKDIAKELLKGALDLQDSLNMLGKLQEASQYMAQLKKKQKEKPERRKFDAVGRERTNSHLSGDHNNHLEFQKPRISADGSSRDCIEELRDAIRDSFARQNLLQNISTQGRTSFDSRKVESISHLPSTSSSQFSVVPSNKITSSDSTVSQIALEKKGKGPNLIAKLMGLEDMPSKKSMQPPEGQLDMEKNLSQQRPVFDIEMPKLRKPQPIIQKVDSEGRTLKELLETVQFQGLLKSSLKELKSQSHQSSDFHYKQRSVHDISPIVLIKPLRVPCIESEEAPAPMVWEEGSLSTKMLLRKLKIKEEFSSRSIDKKDSKLHCRTDADETLIKRVIQEGAKDHVEIVAIPEEKEVRTIEQKDVDVKVKKVHRKMEAEKAPVRRFSNEEREKDHQRAVRGAEQKEVKKNLKDSSIVKGYNSATHQQQRKETTEKKVDKSQKLMSSSRKPVEREIVKTKIVSRSQDQPKLTSTKLRKPENESDKTNHQNRVTTRKTISKLTTQTTIRHSNVQMQKEEHASEHRTSKPTNDNLECREDDEMIDLMYNDHSEKDGSTIIHADQLSIKKESNDSKFQIEEHYGADQSFIMPTSGYGENASPSKQAYDQMTRIRTDDTSFRSAYPLKDLLLSSSSFINLANELFHLNMSYPKILPTSGICDSGVTDVKLSLDYANEFIERRSLPDSQTRHSLLSYMGNRRIHLSLDQLAEEICGGIETLRSYQKPACNYLLTDNLFATFEKDIWCRGVVSGIWDLGWRNGFSMDEVEQALSDLEKWLVSELIEEVFS